MPRFLKLACSFLGILTMLATAAPAAAETRSLSQGRLFSAGENEGAENPAIDDPGWRSVVVPHDWSIMDKPDGSPPFDAAAIAGQDSGYLPDGIGWYRRHLDLTATEWDEAPFMMRRKEILVPRRRGPERAMPRRLRVRHSIADLLLGENV